MKKIFTLSIAVALLAAAHAQNGSGNNRGDQRNDQPTSQRDNQYGHDNGVKNSPYDKDWNKKDNAAFERNKAMRIAQVNREYEYKIQKVQHSFFMSRSEKKRQVRFLEAQRLQEIRRIQFDTNRNRYDDRDDHSNRRY